MAQDEDLNKVCERLNQAMNLRLKYTPCGDQAELWFDSQMVKKSGVTREPSKAEKYEVVDGIVHVYDNEGNSLFPVPSLGQYYDDMETLFKIRMDGPVNSFSYSRLRMLQTRFELYSMTRYGEEVNQQRLTKHRDFYNVRKVDNHIHHAAAMNAKHLSRFMKRKFKKCTADVVERDDSGTPIKTLGEIAEELGISWQDISLDMLQMWTDRSCMHRFDRFNNLYSPMGQGQLRTLFLKTDNSMGGRYFAEITKELLDDLEDFKYQHTEWRLSIYGKKRDEWDNLAKWVLGREGKGTDKALLSTNNMWMIQIPRLYIVYKNAQQLENFQQMLDNIFLPLFEVTMDPTSHPELYIFLQHIGGFDTVDDESKSYAPTDRHFSSRGHLPKDWSFAVNPSYKYYSFYIQSNLKVLNRLRHSKGLNQIQYRPHAGEAGEIHHLDTAFLLADGINHGLNLRRSMPLQYLFFLTQIGISMSPASNNQLFLPYEKSPFFNFFKRGLNITLSTDDPLMFHQTKEPLLEEYAIAKQVWKLDSTDMCEIARNSVLQCSFPIEKKLEWLGVNRPEEMHTKNVMYFTNVPDLRFKFRLATLAEELAFLSGQEYVVEEEQKDVALDMRPGHTVVGCEVHVRLSAEQEEEYALANEDDMEEKNNVIGIQRDSSAGMANGNGHDYGDVDDLDARRVSTDGRESKRRKSTSMQNLNPGLVQLTQQIDMDHGLLASPKHTFVNVNASPEFTSGVNKVVPRTASASSEYNTGTNGRATSRSPKHRGAMIDQLNKSTSSPGTWILPASNRSQAAAMETASASEDQQQHISGTSMVNEDDRFTSLPAFERSPKPRGKLVSTSSLIGGSDVQMYRGTSQHEQKQRMIQDSVLIPNDNFQLKRDAEEAERKQLETAVIQALQPVVWAGIGLLVGALFFTRRG